VAAFFQVACFSLVFRKPGFQELRDTLVTMPIVAIILAAGASSRLGQPKQLLRIGEETLLEGALRIARDAGAAPVLVVLGAHAEAIGKSIAFKGAIPVQNDLWPQGISTSIHAGLRAIEACALQPSGVLIMPCDQVRLTAAHLSALILTFEAYGEDAIIASTYAGVLGIPAVFPRSVFANLYALTGDKGARSLLAAPPCSVIPLPFEGGEVDVDLPADLKHIK
jgi:CTP:molybdopterin cytidylyltransferase MocA